MRYPDRKTCFCSLSSSSIDPVPDGPARLFETRLRIIFQYLRARCPPIFCKPGWVRQGIAERGGQPGYIFGFDQPSVDVWPDRKCQFADAGRDHRQTCGQRFMGCDAKAFAALWLQIKM